LELKPFDMTVSEAYRRWLFHGPIFHGIQHIEGISSKGLVAQLRTSSPQQCLASNGGGVWTSWLIDPIVFDSALQTIIVWTRAHLDATPLPSRFRRYQRFATRAGSSVLCYLQVTSPPANGLFSVDIAFVGEDGRLIGLLEEMEAPSSKSLNRLAG
jgi:hypothetical protein